MALMWRQNAADFSRCWGLRECGARPESRGLSLQRMRRELKKTQQLKKNAGRVNAIPAVFPVLHPRLKRSQRKPAESSAIASHWQSRSRAHSPPAWRLGQRRSRLKFQTGWGRNFIQERRESASTMRVQSHRRHSRSKVAAAVCAILIMRPKFRRADRPASVRICRRPALRCGRMSAAATLTAKLRRHSAHGTSGTGGRCLVMEAQHG